MNDFWALFKKTGTQYVAGFLIFFLVVCGCATNRGKGDSAVSPAAKPSIASSEEIAIGEKIHRQILSDFYPYTDPKVVEYINKILECVQSIWSIIFFKMWVDILVPDFS